ncbi:amidohydrolase family protein [Bacillus licheniformis]|nr:amidohydrolase family protein [Bacillus licheniformis]
MLIEGSVILDVAESIEAGDAEIVDASNMLIMPGFVDTHRHVWESVIRGIGADWSLQTYLNRIYYGNYGSMRRPEDDWAANYLGALEALDAGVTTLLDWTMIESPDHTDQLIAGLKDAGIRAVFAFGTSGDAEYWDRDSDLSNMDEAKRVKSIFQSKDQLLTMGLAIRGPEFLHGRHLSLKSKRPGNWMPYAACILLLATGERKIVRLKAESSRAAWSRFKHGACQCDE